MDQALHSEFDRVAQGPLEQDRVLGSHPSRASSSGAHEGDARFSLDSCDVGQGAPGDQLCKKT